MAIVFYNWCYHLWKEYPYATCTMFRRHVGPFVLTRLLQLSHILPYHDGKQVALWQTSCALQCFLGWEHATYSLKRDSEITWKLPKQWTTTDRASFFAVYEPEPLIDDNKPVHNFDDWTKIKKLITSCQFLTSYQRKHEILVLSARWGPTPRISTEQWTIWPCSQIMHYCNFCIDHRTHSGLISTYSLLFTIIHCNRRMRESRWLDQWVLEIYLWDLYI